MAAFEKNVEDSLSDEAYAIVIRSVLYSRETYLWITGFISEVKSHQSKLDEAKGFTAAISKYTQLKKATL